MNLFHLSELLAQREQSGRAYLEFLRVPALSAGIYSLPAGAVDPQKPHHEDEVYYVISGRATMRVAEEDQPIQTGSIIFVPAEVVHRFHTILEDLTVLVFFAPAEKEDESII